MFRAQTLATCSVFKLGFFFPLPFYLINQVQKAVVLMRKSLPSCTVLNSVGSLCSQVRKSCNFNAESPSECRQPGRYNEQASVLDGFPDPQRENAVMSKQKSLACFQSLVLLGLTLLYYVLFCISKSPFCSRMLQTWGLHAPEHCPSVAMVTHAHPPSALLHTCNSRHGL